MEFTSIDGVSVRPDGVALATSPSTPPGAPAKDDGGPAGQVRGGMCLCMCVCVFGLERWLCGVAHCVVVVVVVIGRGGIVVVAVGEGDARLLLFKPLWPLLNRCFAFVAAFASRLWSLWSSSIVLFVVAVAAAIVISGLSLPPESFTASPV